MNVLIELTWDLKQSSLFELKTCNSEDHTLEAYTDKIFNNRFIKKPMFVNQYLLSL